VPWRGPEVKGEFPTLGYLVGQWIEENLIVPDGPRMGAPYLLTDEMWRFLLRFYRLRLEARAEDGQEAYKHYGGQLVRPQKWGKDPFAGADAIAEALGPVGFAGWDAAGEPVGMPLPSPWVQCVATAEDQTANTFAPIVTMLRDGPLGDTPGLDIGETRIKLPGVGWIEPATSSGRARLGARLTFATFTETHLFHEATGGVTLAKAMKRNLAGMGGRWLEITNAWDPSENSVAQRTYKAKAPGVLIDYRPPRGKVDLEDDAALREEIRYVYGDSITSKGGWVREGRIIADIRDESTGEGEARRYFLNDVVVGTKDAIDAIKWAAFARPGELLAPGTKVALGFDGSLSRDATALIACRLSDGRLFTLRVWEHDGSPEWQVPRVNVDEAVRGAFDAYEVGYLYADPYRWQDYLNTWEAAFPGKIVEFSTASEQRMDKAIERFLTAFRGDEITHDGDETLTRHALNAALAKGKHKAASHEVEDEDDSDLSTHYLRVVKKKQGHWIDAFIAAILAYTARGKAIEDGFNEVKEAVEPWAQYA
jgi:hypothetical protein